MKKLTVLLLALLMIACFWGCAKEPSVPDATDSVPQQTQDSTSPDVTEPQSQPTTPVEDDVFYFANDLEYYRLYSMREDGTDLKLVVDKYCYDVKQQGDTVYFNSGNCLQSYHIPSGVQTAVVEKVLDYDVNDSYLVYTLNAEEFYCTYLRCRDLKTGEDFLVASATIGDFALQGNDLFYIDNNFECSSSIKLFRLDTREDITLFGGFSYCYYPYAVEGGVIFQGYTDELGANWYFASSNGEILTPLYNVPDNFDVYSFTRSSALCVDSSFFSEKESTVLTVNTLGEREVLYTSAPGSYLLMTELGNGRWLIREQFSEGVGNIDEYGIYDNYIYHFSFFLLRADKSVIPLNIRGVLGSMFASGDFPLIDSSTARKPVTQNLYDVLVRNFEYEGKEPICSTTHGAWLNIADRKADLALLAAPTKEEQDYLKEKGVEVEMKLYGGDGLVFIGNKANPVTNLTREQLIAIYRGEITNWREVGGPNQKIIVYYRDDQSGSQRLFENLVFKGKDIPDFAGLGFYIQDDMSTIVNTILSDPYAIGYSIMTYLDEVYAEEELQVFSINGASPTPETVKDGSYPFNTKGYLVIRSDEPADSPARRLFNWFGCPVSDDILRMNGVSPLSDGVG